MTDLVDPVQSHIYAITVRDSIVPDDASDLQLPAVVSAKQVARLKRALLPGVDFVGTGDSASLDDPVGRRVGRVAFTKPLQALWIDGIWTGAGPAPYRLPDDPAAIADFICRQTHLGDGTPESDARVTRLLGFSISDHAQVTDTLRVGGARARLFIAASMLSAACASYEKARQRTEATGRGKVDANNAAAEVEATLIGAARIATETVLSNTPAPPGILCIARHLVDQAEAVRRNRPRGRPTGAIRIAASAADAVHRWLTRGILHDLPLNHDREAARLPLRLATRDERMVAMVDAVIADIAAIDTSALYVLLMARRLDVALGRHRWLAAPHPVFRLNYGYIGGHALFVEVERLGAIVAAMADREIGSDGVSLNSKSLRTALSAPSVMQSTIAAQDAPGRYLDLGAYHRVVTNGFIRDQARWMATTASSYPHHAYALGSRNCDLAAAAAHTATHNFIRRTELDKPSKQGNRQQPLVLFYGLDSQETAILGLRQILDRLIMRGASTDEWARPSPEQSIISSKRRLRWPRRGWNYPPP